MNTYIILDYFGSRKGTVKANSRKEAHFIYADGIKWFLENTICFSEVEYTEIRNNFKN